MKNRLSTLIIDFHPNRTLIGLYSKIRQLESLVLHLIDEKPKIFSALSNRDEEEGEEQK